MCISVSATGTFQARWHDAVSYQLDVSASITAKPQRCGFRNWWVAGLQIKVNEKQRKTMLSRLSDKRRWRLRELDRGDAWKTPGGILSLKIWRVLACPVRCSRINGDWESGELGNLGLPGKWPLKWRVSECVCVRDNRWVQEDHETPALKQEGVDAMKWQETNAPEQPSQLSLTKVKG